jgi:hypothetical protein
MAQYKVINVSEHNLSFGTNRSMKRGVLVNGKWINGEMAIIDIDEMGQVFNNVRVLEKDGQPFIDERFIEEDIRNEQKQKRPYHKKSQTITPDEA